MASTFMNKLYGMFGNREVEEEYDDEEKSINEWKLLWWGRRWRWKWKMKKDFSVTEEIKLSV